MLFFLSEPLSDTREMLKSICDKCHDIQNVAIDWDLKFCAVASRSFNTAMTFPIWFCFLFEFTFILIMSNLIAFHPFSVPVSCTVLEFYVVIYQTKHEWSLWNACLLMSSTRVLYVNRNFLSCPVVNPVRCLQNMFLGCQSFAFIPPSSALAAFTAQTGLNFFV